MHPRDLRAGELPQEHRDQRCGGWTHAPPHPRAGKIISEAMATLSHSAKIFCDMVDAEIVAQGNSQTPKPILSAVLDVSRTVAPPPDTVQETAVAAAGAPTVVPVVVPAEAFPTQAAVPAAPAATPPYVPAPTPVISAQAHPSSLFYPRNGHVSPTPLVTTVSPQQHYISVLAMVGISLLSTLLLLAVTGWGGSRNAAPAPSFAAPAGVCTLGGASSCEGHILDTLLKMRGEIDSLISQLQDASKS